MVCVNYQALASLILKSVELTWPAQWKTVATAAIFAARDFSNYLHCASMFMLSEHC